MRLLGISGSPREGATAYVVREALTFAASLGNVETEFISLKGKKIGFCLHCDYCVRTREGCVQKDDVVELYPSLEAADAWLLATPVYQGTMSGQLKAVLDRCRALVARNPDVFKNKVGAAVAVGGDRVGGQEPAIMAIHAFYLANKMIPVSGGPFGSNLGGTVWSRDKKAEGAAADEVGMKTVYRTVERLVEVTRLLRAGEGA
ncbi:MAG: flavodoxin family protein [Anaerolineae bacterium]|jgi:multimeric flavodoxin WrbA|nr:flavodoxin family protein [Anaerolineae bacterium]MDH7474334.1 flavodoxin family protein [Anaerolineae bacterium]